MSMTRFAISYPCQPSVLVGSEILFKVYVYILYNSFLFQSFFFFQNFGCQQFFGELIAQWYAIAVYFLGAFEQVAVCHEIDFRYADF